MADQFEETRNELKAQLELGKNNAYRFIELMSEEDNLLHAPESYDEVTAYGIKLTLADSEGGFEGGGEYAERVYSIQAAGELAKFNNVLVRVMGTYNSYNGTEWDSDSWTFVKAVKVAKDEYVKQEYFDKHPANRANLKVLAVNADELPRLTQEEREQLLVSLEHFKKLLTSP